MTTSEKLSALRDLMRQHDLQAFIVTNADPHLSEYMADFYKYRSWFSGFTGSAGTVLVTEEMAGLWTDGRYYLQAENQLKGSGIQLFKAAEPHTPSIPEYLAEHLPPGARLGFDGKALDAALMLQLKKQLKKNKVELVADKPLVAELWKRGRPALPEHPLYELEPRYSGRSSKDKLADLRVEMDKLGLDLYLCGCLEACAWLSNLRAKDIIEFNTTFPSYVAVSREQAILFMEAYRITARMKMKLEGQGLQVRPYEQILPFVAQIPEGWEVGMALRWTNALLYSSIPDKVIKTEIDDLITNLKAIKNDKEIGALLEGHRQDGVAFVKFLRWFEEQPANSLQEWDVSQKLTELRAARPTAKGDSFNGIIAYGANAAMMHYAPDHQDSARIGDRGFLLMDSGSQYLGCTTDITRTIACGELTEEEKAHFTLVLRSVIGLSRATFLEGTSGLALDILSRGLMWQNDLNYKCGTGHGVGAGLSVHEGPQNFSSPVKLKENMTITIEPGIYLDGVRGIRTENQVYVTKDRFVEGVGQFFRFEEMTMAPIDRRAIAVEQLSDQELAWLNDYHARVAKNLQPYLDAEENAWLAEKTAPLSR